MRPSRQSHSACATWDDATGLASSDVAGATGSSDAPARPDTAARPSTVGGFSVTPAAASGPGRPGPVQRRAQTRHQARSCGSAPGYVANALRSASVNARGVRDTASSCTIRVRARRYTVRLSSTTS